MPELPGPPEDWSDEQRCAWFKGAATVAQLQADQWAIIAKQYREAADGEQSDGGDSDDSDDDGDGQCPDCGTELVDGLGGATCPNCGTSSE